MIWSGKGAFNLKALFNLGRRARLHISQPSSYNHLEHERHYSSSETTRMIVLMQTIAIGMKDIFYCLEFFFAMDCFPERF